MELNYLSDLKLNMVLKIKKNYNELRAGDIIQIRKLDDYDEDNEIKIYWKWLYSKDKKCIGEYDYGYFSDYNDYEPVRELICNLFEVVE